MSKFGITHNSVDMFFVWNMQVIILPQSVDRIFLLGFTGLIRFTGVKHHKWYMYFITLIHFLLHGLSGASIHLVLVFMWMTLNKTSVVPKGIHPRLANITTYYIWLSTNHRLATWASRCERSGDKWELQVLIECASQYVISSHQCELWFQRHILQRQNLQPLTGIRGCFAAPTG